MRGGAPGPQYPTAFPSGWVLPPATEQAPEESAPSRSGTFPRSWTLPNAPEGSPGTSALPISPNNTPSPNPNRIAIIPPTPPRNPDEILGLPSPRSFKQNWTLPQQPASQVSVPSPAFLGTTWSPSTQARNDSAAGNAFQVSPASLTSFYSPTGLSSTVPGNFRHQHYSGAQVSPFQALGKQQPSAQPYNKSQLPLEDRGGQPFGSLKSSGLSAGSSYCPAGFRLVISDTSPPVSVKPTSAGEYYLPRPAGHIASNTSPDGIVQDTMGDHYHLPRPAGHITNNTSPYNVVGDQTGNHYHPPRPLGHESHTSPNQYLLPGEAVMDATNTSDFVCEDVPIPTSSQQSAGPSLETATLASQAPLSGRSRLAPADDTQPLVSLHTIGRGSRRDAEFPSIEIPAYPASAMKDGNEDILFSANPEMFYRLPAAPMTGTAPWKEGEIRWKVL
ncbi:hypothetical protein B0T16DRAFT_418086 [Cercophora newfieldiana]|uniref:Uncharacterized protein n=1 Tax=Cercophora newfieldiana TaxID=92897 RepID=A0AA39Y412_9PEZI|nr:hypothetical protein B0T16DRAFT_418086 [Cercophora newfieldiana]